MEALPEVPPSAWRSKRCRTLVERSNETYFHGDTATTKYPAKLPAQVNYAFCLRHEVASEPLMSCAASATLHILECFGRASGQ